MPAIPVKYDPNNKKLNKLADDERTARLNYINTLWAYYNGEHRQPLRVQQGQANDNIILNFSGQSIDKKVAFFAPKPPKFRVKANVEREPGASGLQVVDPPEQAAIDTFWKANRLQAFINDLGLSGFVAGHNFLRLYAPLNDKPISVDNPPRITLLDARLVTVFWDASDIHRPLFYRLTWENGEEMRRQDIVPAWLLKSDTSSGPATEEDQYWQIIEYKSKTGVKWEEIGRDSWDYPFSPVMDWKNRYAPHQYYGQSDLKDADLNDSINFIASNTARIIRFHAHPRTIAKNVDTETIKATSIDGLWEIRGDGAEIVNLEMQSDLSSSLNMLDLLRAAFFTQMRVVDLASMKDRLGQITNFGVRMLYKDQTDDNDMKRSIYGPQLAEATRRAAYMMGMKELDVPIDEWADPLPVNVLEMVTALEKEKALGAVSVQTIQEDLNRDPVVEAERMAEESNNSSDVLAGLLQRNGQRGFLG